MWPYVSTSINPAYLILTECLISELGDSRFYFDGPKILWGDFHFDSIGVQREDDQVCSTDTLLGPNKVSFCSRKQ